MASPTDGAGTDKRRAYVEITLCSTSDHRLNSTCLDPVIYLIFLVGFCWRS